MAMLAEGKSKSKWVLNPRGTNAINEMHFGRKMLEKMGWQSGDGLGANKQGVTEPLRVSYKNDVKGIGYKKNADNEWLKVEDEFSKILQNLSSDGNASADAEVTIESLEKKSEGSKARLHYRKFTRNKDLSRYSEKDLSCILGHVKNSDTTAGEDDEEDSKFQDKGTMDSYFNQLTRQFSQNTCEIGENASSSVEESKAEKMHKKKRKFEESVLESDNIEITVPENFDELSNSEISKSKRKKSRKEEIKSKVSEKTEDSCVKSFYIQKTVGDFSESKKTKSKKLKFLETNKIEESSEKPAETDENLSLEFCEGGSESFERKRKKKKVESSLGSDDVENSLNLQEIDSTLTDTSTMPARKKPENNWEDSKFDESSSKSNTLVYVGTNRRKKKKSRENSNETEVMINAPAAVNSSEIEDIKRKSKTKCNKRKCNFMENGRSRSSAEESCEDSDNESKKTNARKNEILEESAVEKAVLLGGMPDGFGTEKNSSSLNDEKETQSKEKNRRKSKQSLVSDERAKKEGKEAEDCDLRKVKTEKKKKSRRGEVAEKPEDAPEESGGKTGDFEVCEASSSKKKMFKDSKEVDENGDSIIESVKLEGKSFSDESSKKKKKSKKEKVETLMEGLEEVGDSGVKKVKFEGDSSSKDNSKSKTDKFINSDEKPTDKTDDLNAGKSEIENNSMTDEVPKKKKSKKHKTKDFSPEKTETADDGCSDGGRKKKKSETDETQGAVELTKVVVKSEIFEDEKMKRKNNCSKGESSKKKKNKVTDSEISPTQVEEVEDTLISSYSKEKLEKKLETSQNSAENEATKKSKSKKRKAETSLEISEEAETSNGDKSNSSSPSSKTADKKAKLLALLAKTTKDSDDSDSDSDGSTVVPSSCFKGSNFEQIPGYRNLNRS